MDHSGTNPTDVRIVATGAMVDDPTLVDDRVLIDDPILVDDRPRNTRGAPDESGFTVAAAIWVMGVTLVLVTSFANLFVHRYAQAVIRQATDEGARAWAVNGGTAAECQAAADDVVSDLLGGTLARDVVISCADNGDTVAVTATATLAALPPLPDSSFATTSIVTKELRDDEIATP